MRCLEFGFKNKDSKPEAIQKSPPLYLPDELRQHLLYIIAVNYKSLGNVSEAEKHYKILLPEILKSERKQLIMHTWGLIILILVK